MLEEFRGGNIHFLVVWLVVIAIDRIERSQPRRGGAALAVAIAAKLTPALFVPLLLLRRQLRAVVATIAALALIFVTPAAIWGMRMNVHLLEGFALFARSKGSGASNESFRGLVIHLLTSNPVIGQGALHVTLTPAESVRVDALWLTFSAVVLAAFAAAAWRPPADVRTRLLDYSAVMMIILLISPHTQRIYFCSLFFPCAVLSAQPAGPAPSRHRRLIHGSLAAAFAIGSLLPALLPGRDAAFAYERLWPHAFLTLWLLVLTLILRRSHTAGDPVDPQSTTFAREGVGGAFRSQIREFRRRPITEP
jgi:hypothetical protein